MNRKIKENHKLPHLFEYLEYTKVKKKSLSRTGKLIYYVSSDTLQTDFVESHRPLKNLVRYI